MSEIGYQNVEISKQEHRFYQELVQRLDYAIERSKDDEDVHKLLKKIRYGSRAGRTQRQPTNRTKNLLDKWERK